jgi:hypothetical protein
MFSLLPLLFTAACLLLTTTIVLKSAVCVCHVFKLHVICVIYTHTQQVDEMLLMNLRKIKLQVMKQEKGKKGSKKAKKPKKAKKGGKGKEKKV